MKKRVMLVFGTRPEAIKMAPVYRALRADADRFETLCCVSAQHRELLDQVLEIFDIEPDIDLDLMSADQDLSVLTARTLEALRSVYRAARPDLVLVHGDTATAFAAATAAFYARVPVGHVEAGLRSYDLSAPFPEEFNRRAIDMVAQYRFAPTKPAEQNLRAEGCDPSSIFVTGNTVIDAVLEICARIDRDSEVRERIERTLDTELAFEWRRERFVLVTCHRRENHHERLDSIATALGRVAEAFPSDRFVLPVHPNPAVSKRLRQRLGNTANIHLIEPLAYDCFAQALRSCHFLISDSGGLQEEAAALHKPILVMRELTERPEALDSGGAKLVGTDADRIFRATSELLSDRCRHEQMAAAPNPFGDGEAARKIASFLASL